MIKLKFRNRIIFSLLFLLASTLLFAENPGPTRYFNFSSPDSLKLWQAKFFRGKTVYCIGKDRAVCFLDAKSKNSSSALYYKFKKRFSIKDYPLISWHWRIVKFPDTRKPKAYSAGEDYALRIYVIFPSWSILASKAIEYVWDEYLPEGTILTSTTSKNLKLIIAHTGKIEGDLWIFEECNVYEDYKKAFGCEPHLRVGAVAIMCDSDTHKDSAHAQLLDLKVGYKK